MAQYATCELCGAHLDFGEKCDCAKERKKEGAPPKAETPKKKKAYIYYTTNLTVCQ